MFSHAFSHVWFFVGFTARCSENERTSWSPLSWVRRVFPDSWQRVRQMSPAEGLGAWGRIHLPIFCLNKSEWNI